jgi:hypothetical protein
MLLNLLSPDDLAPILAKLDALLGHAAAAAQPADDYLSVAQVAAATYTSQRTVRKWIEDGKRDAQGRLIKLFTLEFSPGYHRIPRSALLAFGQSMGFDAAQLPLPPAGTLPAAATKTKRTPVLDSGQAMRKAS